MPDVMAAQCLAYLVWKVLLLSTWVVAAPDTYVARGARIVAACVPQPDLPDLVLMDYRSPLSGLKNALKGDKIAVRNVKSRSCQNVPFSKSHSTEIFVS